MSIFESLTVNLIFLLFPFLVYGIYMGYHNHVKEEKVVLDLAIFTSMFLMIRYANRENFIANVIFINFPLLISFLKKRNINAMILSAVTIYYYYVVFNIPLLYGIVEYGIYLLIYFYLLKKKKVEEYLFDCFISIKAFSITFTLYIKEISLSLTLERNAYILFIIILFIITMTSILLLIKEGEKIIEKNKILKELQKEKELKLALFKLTHEIKNPLAVCKGYLEMLEHNKENVEKYLPIITDEINRTLIVINSFSDYGKLKIEREEVDIVMLIEDIKDTLDPIFRKNKVKTKYDIKEEEIYIELDYDRMKQVLINIYKNAIEAKKEEENLTIKTTIKKLPTTVEIIIEDNGVGMAEETLEKISKIFYTTKSNGTGLGVALSKEIIEQHQGKLNYESKLGSGTKVTITLPVKEKGQSLNNSNS